MSCRECGTPTRSATLCRRCYNRDWHARNADRVRENKRQYSEQNRERIAARASAYYYRNRETIRRKQRQHYLENRERILAEQRAAYARKRRDGKPRPPRPKPKPEVRRPVQPTQGRHSATQSLLTGWGRP